MESAADSRVLDSRTEGDEPLWRRSLGGDGAAFGLLFDRHRQRVFRHACRLLPTQHDAEDVVASAFLELWRRRAAVRLVHGSILPWLLVTTTNLCRNSVRGKRRYRQFLDRLPRAHEQPDVAEIAMDDHALGIDPRLAAGLRSLSRIDAQLFALVALEGYSVGDAAALLGLSLAAARTRMHRARSTLREQLVGEVRSFEAKNQGGER